MYRIIYYTDQDKSPIVDFLLQLSPKARAKVLREIDLLKEYGFALGMPSIKKISGTSDLWELRVKQSSNNYRVFYFQSFDETFVLLHAFHKKSQKAPRREIDTAIRRMKKFNKGSVN